MFSNSGLRACQQHKSQFSCLNFVINSNFSKVFDNRSQAVYVADILEMFNCMCVSAEQNVAMHKTKFLRKVRTSLSDICCFLATL